MRKVPNEIIRSDFEGSPGSDIDEITFLDIDENLFGSFLTLEERTG